VANLSSFYAIDKIIVKHNKTFVNLKKWIF
jgi:hypothetical protein